MNPSTLTTLAATVLIGAPTALAQFTFAPIGSIPAGTRPSGVAAGDFDGDGDLDLATTTDNPDRILTFLNDGTGVHTAGPTALLPASSSPQDLVAGDLDGDGDVDLAVALRDPAGSVQVMLNGGAGTFVAGASVPVGARPRGMSIADIDGDGDLDIAVANRDDNSASILTNSGAATFAVATIAVGGETRDTAFADWDADGDSDLAVTNHDARQVALFTNTGAGFIAAGTLSVGGAVRPDGVDAADLDNDGDMDIAVGTSDQTLNIQQVAIFMNTGVATFTGPSVYNTGGTNTSDVIAADLDCDGLVDVIAANADSANLSLLRNTGGGILGAAQLLATGATPGRPVAADLDGDGDADLAVDDRDSNDLRTYRNDTCTISVPGDATGDGIVNFADILAVIGDWGPCAGCATDLDGDGMVGFSDILLVIGNWS